MMHLSKRNFVFTLGFFLFASVLIYYFLGLQKNDAGRHGATSGYKITTPEKEEESVRSYKVVYDTPESQIDDVVHSMAAIKQLSYKHENFESRAIAYLRSYMDDSDLSIHDYRFLIEFRRYIETHFPDGGKERLYLLIDKSFFKINNEIKNFYENLEKFENWFQRNRNLFAAMTGDEIKAALREKRLDIFGKDASGIWDEKSKEVHFQDFVLIFEDASHIPLENKAVVFATIWDDMIHENDPHLSAMLRKFQRDFLNMDSVQMELKLMAPSKRAESLANIRKIMGYDGVRIDEMEKFDIREDKLWSNGQFYMAERQYIMDKYDGIDREIQLNALRKRYFKDESAIIAAEEAADIFRFKRKRIYGHR